MVFVCENQLTSQFRMDPEARSPFPRCQQGVATATVGLLGELGKTITHNGLPSSPSQATLILSVGAHLQSASPRFTLIFKNISTASVSESFAKK